MYKPTPRFNDHGSSCKGHANAMLDSEMTTREERDLMIRAINNYVPDENNSQAKGVEHGASGSKVLDTDTRAGSEVRPVQI